MNYIICRFKTKNDSLLAVDSVLVVAFNHEAMMIACRENVVGRYGLSAHDKIVVKCDSQDRIREMMGSADPWSAFAQLPKADGT